MAPELVALKRERDEHPVAYFRRWMEANLPEGLYSQVGLVPVGTRRIHGVAAFPASHGLYAACGWDHAQLPPFPVGGLMVVGNNLDAEDAFTTRIKDGKAHGDPCPGAETMKFWRGLYQLLDRADIDREQLFATNVHPALIPGKDPRGSVRRTSAFGDWQRRTSLFLRLQIREMQPRVIAAFGNDARIEVAASLALEPPAVPGMLPITLEGHRAVFVVLRHPSAAQSHEAFAMTVETLKNAWRF